ncbi:MAG: hypothetical protein WAM05_08920 [Candidatus Binataceae bacterium]
MKLSSQNMLKITERELTIWNRRVKKKIRFEEAIFWIIGYVKTLMNIRNILLCSLVSFSSLFLFILSASAQCTPVVYAFRHAEDAEDGSYLTQVGRQHADLYVPMVHQFESDNNYCAVGFVYSMYNYNLNGSPGTNNPFQTAEPLAIDACNNSAVDPSTTCVGSKTLPRMALNSGAKLYEYLGGTKEDQVPSTAQTTALRGELLSYAKPGVGAAFSTAIFWTSDGLHTLGLAIADGTEIPKKIKNANGDTISSPPRNAVYVFKYNGNTFDPPPNVTQYVQCFNANGKVPNGTTYYCSQKGNLPSDIATELLPNLLGNICDTTDLAMNCRIQP